MSWDTVSWIGWGVLCVLVALLLSMSHWGGLRTYWILWDLDNLTKVPLIGDAVLVALTKPEDMFATLQKYLVGHRYKKAMIIGLPLVILNHPDDIECLLSSTVHLKKGFEYNPLQTWLREGLLLSFGNKWRQRRKLLTPTFHFSILEGNVGQIASHTKIFIKKLLGTGGKPIILDDIVRHYTLDVICETAMGLKLDSQENKSTEYVEAIKRSTEKTVKRVLAPWLRRDWVYNLTPDGISFKRDIKTLHKFTEDVIETRKKLFAKQKEQDTEIKRKAFLDLLLETEEKNPGVLTPMGLREEVDTFMFEGHDTTSAAIVHALYALATNPHVQKRCWEEQQQLFGSDKREPTREDLQEMVYLEMFIKEVLRMYPSVPYISRVLTQDLTLSDGRIIPSSVNVVIIPFLVHRREELWENPEEFRPERFLPGTSRHPYSYIPFSAGPRNCIGMKFAMLELKTTLSAVLRHCHVEPVTTKLSLTPNVILKSLNPVQVRILPRE